MKKLFSFIVGFMVFAFTFGSTALAHHYIWLFDDGGKQYSSISGTESYVSWWWLNGAITSYTAPSSFSTNVSSAVTNWNNNIPSAVKLSSGGSDLTFSSGTLTCSSTALGCFVLNTAYNDTDRGANFTLTASIGLNTSSAASSKWTSILAHEIGHYIGFHEGYVEGTSVTCNSSRSTVMDAVGCEDLTGPSASDVTYIKNALGGDQAQANIQSTAWSGNVLTVNFKDQSYGELYYILDYYRVTTSGKTYLYSRNITKDTGLRQGLAWTSDKVVKDSSFSKANYSSGTYQVVITPYFKSYGKIGKQVYTNFTF